MATENGGQLEKGGKSAIAAVILGLAVGVVSLLVAFEVTYEGAGPEDSDALTILTILTVSGMIFAIVMIYMGAVAYSSPGMSGEEATGFVEVRRKRP
ncbi:MAG: hypothetical protein KJ672_05220 [Candidatus Thermoplasmatota archaeon]|nr:hypothetical protein [Candidatus Thermoplasmatota archaeon]